MLLKYKKEWIHNNYKLIWELVVRMNPYFAKKLAYITKTALELKLGDTLNLFIDIKHVAFISFISNQ